MIDKIKRFEAREVRTHWDAEQDKWYFSIVDVLAVLTESLDPAAYWRKLKQRLKTEGNQSVTNCHALKMRAADGRSRLHRSLGCTAHAPNDLGAEATGFEPTLKAPG